MPSIAAGFPVISAIHTGTGPFSTQITVPAGLTNACLAVFTQHEDAGGNVSSITANGDPLTFRLRRADGTWSHVEYWRLHNPDAGTYNVTYSKAAAGGNRWRVKIYLLLDVDPTTPDRTPVGNNGGSGTSGSATVAGVAATDLLLDELSVDSTGHSPTPGADQTANYATTNLGGGSNEGRGSRQAGSAGGVMSWTWTGSNPWSLIAVAFVHAAGGTFDDAAAALNVDVDLAGAGALERNGAVTLSTAIALSPAAAAELAAAAALGLDVALAPAGTLELAAAAGLEVDVDLTAAAALELAVAAELELNVVLAPAAVALLDAVAELELAIALEAAVDSLYSDAAAALELDVDLAADGRLEASAAAALELAIALFATPDANYDDAAATLAIAAALQAAGVLEAPVAGELEVDVAAIAQAGLEAPIAVTLELDVELEPAAGLEVLAAGELALVVDLQAIAETFVPTFTNAAAELELGLELAALAGLVFPQGRPGRALRSGRGAPAEAGRGHAQRPRTGRPR